MSKIVPCRVAVIGTGPAAMYAVEHLLGQADVDPSVDLYERLPNPWGLVRNGVAPDHPEKKMVIERSFMFAFRDPRVRFIGGTDIGGNIRHADLAEWYDAVIYATGAHSDRPLRIAGEELPGCWAAREFVGWYNGHPDHGRLPVDLSGRRAVIVGNGNVALDVARILTRPVATLERTDISDHALLALRHSQIEEVVVLARRSLIHSAFHNPELEEFEHIEGLDVTVEGDGFPSAEIDPLERHSMDTKRKIATLARLARRTPTRGNRRIVFRYLTSPLAIGGRGKVEEILLTSNALDRNAGGLPTADPSVRASTISAGLVVRAIGYCGSRLPGLPFDEQRGVIPSRQGRVIDNEHVIAGTYVTGWAKRGCKGVIGSNKKCARETVGSMLEDLHAGRIRPKALGSDMILRMVSERNPGLVSLTGWQAIDRAERDTGRAQHRPRVKITEVAHMLEIAAKACA